LPYRKDRSAVYYDKNHFHPLLCNLTLYQDHGTKLFENQVEMCHREEEWDILKRNQGKVSYRNE